MQRIAYERGLTRAAASAAARREHPLWYEAMQASGLPADTNQTLVAAPIPMGKPTIPMDKSSPSYEQLVARQIAKGDNENVARQKVAYSHPQLARESIAKNAGGDDVVAFHECIMKIQVRDDCSHLEALQKARVENPRAFWRYQNV